MSLYKQCPGAKSIKSPYPEEIRCNCGGILEIWSDEASTVCRNCKKEITRKMAASCLDWCLMAKECIGQAKYKKYLQRKE